jgi:hypothetical protein
MGIQYEDLKKRERNIRVTFVTKAEAIGEFFHVYSPFLSCASTK